MLAVCDSELLGKCISDGKLQLDLTSPFYAGKELTEKEFEETLGQYDNLNIVGERAVAIGKKCGLVDKIITVKGVPHAQVCNLNPVP